MATKTTTKKAAPKASASAPEHPPFVEMITVSPRLVFLPSYDSFTPPCTLSRMPRAFLPYWGRIVRCLMAAYRVFNTRLILDLCLGESALYAPCGYSRDIYAHFTFVCGRERADAARFRMSWVSHDPKIPPRFISPLAKTASVLTFAMDLLHP